MQKNLLSAVVAVFMWCFPAVSGAQVPDNAMFEQIKAKTFDKEKFVFPDDMRGTRLNILFLAMSADRESGEAQQGALLAWHVALVERGVFSDEVMPYHFPVMESPPFFVKGIIIGAMRDSYQGKVPLDQSGVLYVDDLDGFADAAGLKLDDQPTIVIATSDAKPLQVFRGEVSPEGVDEIIVAIEEVRP
jgi:hypothetical protein